MSNVLNLPIFYYLSINTLDLTNKKKRMSLKILQFIGKIKCNMWCDIMNSKLLKKL